MPREPHRAEHHHAVAVLRPDTLVSGGLEEFPIAVRIDHLVQQLDEAKTKIIVPTPALDEALVGAGADRFAADS
jgi:hypothetical protein